MSSVGSRSLPVNVSSNCSMITQGLLLRPPTLQLRLQWRKRKRRRGYTTRSSCRLVGMESLSHTGYTSSTVWEWSIAVKSVPTTSTWDGRTSIGISRSVTPPSFFIPFITQPLSLPGIPPCVWNARSWFTEYEALPRDHQNSGCTRS